MKLNEIGSDQTKGLKIFLIGLATAACGFVLAWLVGADWSLLAGRILFFLGWVIGAIGLGVHFWIMTNSSEKKRS